MLHIILMILKIIGIILLVLLGIVILLLAAVLFIPIRYRVEAEYYGKPKLRVKVTWFLHLVRFLITFDEMLVVRGKVAMFTVYGKKEKERKVDRQIEKGSKSFNKKVKNVFEDEEEKTVKDNLDNTDISDSESESKKESGNDADSNLVSESKVRSDDAVESNLSVKPDSKVLDLDLKEKSDSTVDTQVQSCEEHTQADPIVVQDYFDDEHTNRGQHKLSKHKKRRKRKIGFFAWIKQGCVFLYQKICNIIKAIREYIKKIVTKIISSKNSIVVKIQTVIHMIEDEQNQELVRFLWNQLKHFMHLIRPRKYQIVLHYGFEDPYTTGQVSMYLAMVYGMLGIRMDVTPDFEHEVMEGRILLKGLIQIFGVLMIALRVYTNKLFKKIILKSKKKK